MSRIGIGRIVLAGCAVLLTGLALAVPAHAETTVFNGWMMREDAAPSGTDTTYTWSDSGAAMQLTTGVANSVGVSGGSSQGPLLGATFVGPGGQRLQAGETYPAVALAHDAWEGDPTTPAEIFVGHDGSMCGVAAGQSVPAFKPARPAKGWFHVSEIEYNDLGKVARFAATFEVNCQFLGGPAGVEGSVAVNSTLPPAPLPDAPAAPGPVMNLRAVNVAAPGGGFNTTTLTWSKPEASHDAVVDMAMWSDANLPALVGSSWTMPYDSLGTTYFNDSIDPFEVRTYRVVPRGITGRLGPPSVLTVRGTRINVPESDQTIMIGQVAHFSGRLTAAFQYVDFADVMNGPPVAGVTVLLCRRPGVVYSEEPCTEVDRTTTTADGRFTLSASPIANQYYDVEVPPTGHMLGNGCRAINAFVAPRTDLRAPESQRVSGRASLRRGAVIHFTTSRARAGSRGFIRLQRFGAVYKGL